MTTGNGAVGTKVSDPAKPGAFGIPAAVRRGQVGTVRQRARMHGLVTMRPVALARRTLADAWRDRVLGLAAEAGFWQLLSLPPLLLAILGTIGYLGDAIGGDAVESIRSSLIRGASELLTPSVVDEAVRPTVDEILSRGRPDVISIGFVLSLWTGSTAMATFVNTITIAYGQRDLRSAVRSRLLALRLFLLQVISGVLILPALVLGPGLLSDLLDANRHAAVDTSIKLLFWPVVGVVALAMLTTLYHQSLPVRRPWRRALPGAVLALVLWIIGSYLLRLYLEVVFGNELVYGTLGAPVAALLFFYITALAVLLGAELNAAMDSNRRARQASAAEAAEAAVTATEPLGRMDAPGSDNGAAMDLPGIAVPPGGPHHTGNNHRVANYGPDAPGIGSFDAGDHAGVSDDDRPRLPDHTDDPDAANDVPTPTDVRPRGGAEGGSRS